MLAEPTNGLSLVTVGAGRRQGDLATRNELFVDQRWWCVLQRTYGFAVQTLSMPGPDGTPGGSVAYVDVDDPAGARRVSLPFCDLVDLPCTPEAWAVLRRVFTADGPARLTTMADHPIVDDPEFSTVVDAVHQVVPVAADADPLESFATLPRRMVRKAARNGVTYRAATEVAAMDAFHELHVGVRKYRHGLLAQPRDFFRVIHDEFIAGGDGAVMLAERDGDVLGAVVLLHTESAVHYKFAASHPDARRDGVSHGLVHAALEHTRDTGRPVFDFGRADLDQAGLVDFKRRFGAIATPIATSSRLPLAHPEFRDLLGEMTELYVRPDLPDALAARAGAHLYRYFA